MTKNDTVHQGNLIIRTAQDAERYKYLIKITGDLSINASAKLDAPQLESVGGSLYINASAKLDALKSDGGSLSINASAKLDALKSVGGSLSIYASAKLDAPQLESVGGDLYINASAKLDAPQLESVGGSLSIYENGKLKANKLYTGGYSKFKVYDNIGCVVLSSKKVREVMVLSCRASKIKNQKVIGDKFYIAQKGTHNAHAKTITEALQEIEFKIGNRDISQFKNIPKNMKKSPDEWALVYRMITGACQYGVKNFMASKGKLKKQYTLDQILKETQGAYGHSQFKAIVEAA